MQIKNAKELWELIEKNSPASAKTIRGLEFKFSVKGGEIFIDRKKKSITQASVYIAFEKIYAVNEGVCPTPLPGPKTLGIFGDTYLYAILMKLGVVEFIKVKRTWKRKNII